MGISEQIGGLPSLTAVLVIVTGIIGAVIAQELFDRLRVDDQAARGLAIGVASHGIGTARAFQMNRKLAHSRAGDGTERRTDHVAGAAAGETAGFVTTELIFIPPWYHALSPVPG